MMNKYRFGLLAFIAVCLFVIACVEGVANVTSNAVNGTAGTKLPTTVAATVGDKVKEPDDHESLIDPVTTDKPTDGNVVVDNFVIAEANVSINLSCPLPGIGVIWSKNNQVIENAEKLYIRHDDGNLEVVVPGVEHHGNYQCKVGDKTETATVILYVKPYIRPYKDKKNVIEGDPFVMECQAWGHPDVTLAWYFNGTDITDNDAYVFKPGHRNNSVLRIPHAQFADEGVYECVATNVYSKTSINVTATIKDKYAALWPFLGICAEVAILCAVIFIYEKRRERRIKREQDAADIEEKRGLKENGIAAEADSKQLPDLRQRNK